MRQPVPVRQVFGPPFQRSNQRPRQRFTQDLFQNTRIRRRIGKEPDFPRTIGHGSGCAERDFTIAEGFGNNPQGLIAQRGRQDCACIEQGEKSLKTAPANAGRQRSGRERLSLSLPRRFQYLPRTRFLPDLPCPRREPQDLHRQAPDRRRQHLRPRRHLPPARRG